MFTKNNGERQLYNEKSTARGYIGRTGTFSPSTFAEIVMANIFARLLRFFSWPPCNSSLEIRSLQAALDTHDRGTSGESTAKSARTDSHDRAFFFLRERN